MKCGLLLSLLLSTAMLVSACGADVQTGRPTGNDEKEDADLFPNTSADAPQEGEITYLDDVLGFSGYAVTTETMGDSWKVVDYYAVVDGEDLPVAESFGYLDEPYSKTVAFDLDGDGRSELISFCTFSGDGAERVFARRWNGESGQSEEGYPDWGKADVELSGIGLIYWQESYDAARGVVELRYRGGSEEDDYRTAELPLTMESFLWEAYERNEE